MKYNPDRIARIAKVTLVNLLCLLVGGTLGGTFFGNPLGGLGMSVIGLMVAWPALILAAVYTDRLLVKQAAELNKTEQK